MAKRRLEDLYVLGKEVTLDDGGGDPVVVWLQKMNPMEHEKALRRANAARARTLIARRNSDSEEWQEAYGDVEDFASKDQLIEYLITEDASKARESLEAELSHAEEWAKEEYLQGLRDAWFDEEKPLRETYALDPEDAEARRVFQELKRFDEQVEERLRFEIERLKKDYVDFDLEELRLRATDQMMETRAGIEWLKEYRACEVWLATREPDNHRKYYFGPREAVDELAIEVFERLSSEYQKLIVGVTEGKGLPLTPDSSPSSEPTEKEGSQPSGLAVVSP